MKNTLMILLLCFTTTVAYGSGNHEHNHHNHTNPVVINGVDGVDGINGIDGINGKNFNIGTALGLAFDHQFDAGTLNLQGSLVLSTFDDSEAVSFALAKRTCGTCALITGAIGIEQNKNGKDYIGASVGIGWKFGKPK